MALKIFYNQSMPRPGGCGGMPDATTNATLPRIPKNATDASSHTRHKPHHNQAKISYYYSS
eukprot:scaffold3453_cov230-Skeletonema_marinoi.AAC.12